MKKTLLALTTALTLPATAVLADGPAFQLYAGAQAGGTFSHTKVDTNSRNGANHVNISGHSGDSFATAGIFAGCRCFFGNWFTGFEVEGNWDGMSIKQDQLQSALNDPWKLELKRTHQLIPSATIGWKANDKTLLYAKFGAGISRFEFSEGINSQTNRTKIQNVVHFVPALGCEYELHKYAGLRLEVSGEVAGRYIKTQSITPSGTTAQFSKAHYRSVSVKFGVLVKV